MGDNERTESQRHVGRRHKWDASHLHRASPCFARVEAGCRGAPTVAVLILTKYCYILLLSLL